MAEPPISSLSLSSSISASSSGSSSNSSDSDTISTVGNNKHDGGTGVDTGIDTLTHETLPSPTNAVAENNQSFQHFFKTEEEESIAKIEQMTEFERHQQLNQLLNEESDTSRDAQFDFGGGSGSGPGQGQGAERNVQDDDAHYDVPFNVSADTVSTASKSAGEDEPIPVKPPINDDDDGHVMNVPVLPPVLQEITGSQVDKSDSDSIMDEIEQHRSSLNARSDEVDPEPEPPVKNESLELSDSCSSSSSSSVSSSSSSASSSDFNHNPEEEQLRVASIPVDEDPIRAEEQTQHHEQKLNKEQLSIPIAISASKSMEQTSAFDRAMSDVIHSDSAYKSVSYNGPQNKDSDEMKMNHEAQSQSQSQLQSQLQSPLESQSSMQSTVSSPSSTTIQKVHTLDEEDEVVETALEMSLSLSKSYEGNDSQPQPTLPSTLESISNGPSTGSPPPPPENSIAGGSSVMASSVMSQSSTGGKSLAQQIKQSIDQTPSKPLPRTVLKITSSPTNTRSLPTSISTTPTTTRIRPKPNDLASGSLPDVLTTVRDKIDGLFENERRAEWKDDDEQTQQNRENLRRAFQLSVSAAVLVSLAHKRYERRRLAAMEIEKVVRALVQNRELERVKGILLLLSDDYVRSTNEDARKGGVVAMAACAIGLKKAHDMPGLAGKTNECTDLILASVVHACQDNSQRVRYYATESLFNVIKVLPSLAVDHFFILFEILRSLWADVDVDVRSGAELLDKKLQGIIITSINSGQFDADSCVPLFARFLHMRNKPTKRLTLIWLQAFAENLIGAPLLEFLHMFLYDVFAMLADPNTNIRQLALLFLNSMLPKLLMKNEDFEDSGTHNKVDFDKILQSLVTTMEHPDPFVRKVAMFWVSRIVQAHMGEDKVKDSPDGGKNSNVGMKRSNSNAQLHAASISVRNALEHVLPGLLLSIGDTFQNRTAAKDTFLPDQTTHYLADQTNRCLQNDVRKQKRSYIPHLGGFVVALREELDTRGGLSAKNRSAKERKPYRMDVKTDGSGIESTGWFRTHGEDNEDGETTGHEYILSRLCALDWIVLLFECVVPDSLKDEYAEEFIAPVIRLLYDAPEVIVLKSLEVLSKITVSKGSEFEKSPALSKHSTTNILFQDKSKDPKANEVDGLQSHPMTDANATYALGILDLEEKGRLSRNREVFGALIKSQAKYPPSLSSLSRIIRHMCSLQPPEFVFISFGVELDIFVLNLMANRAKVLASQGPDSKKLRNEDLKVSKDLNFTTKFAQVLSNVLLTCSETERLRNLLKGCIATKGNTTKDERKKQVFHILLKTFAHDPVAAISLCLWCGAFRTASSYIHKINPLDLDLSFYMELDQVVEFIERPLFRDLHLCMLECDENPALEGSGAMLYRVLKSILMLLPQSTSYNILQQRLLSVARFRQCAVHLHGMSHVEIRGTSAEVFVHRILEVRQLHCNAKWKSIRSESLEPSTVIDLDGVDIDKGRRNWLGYENEEEEEKGRMKYRNQHITTSSSNENGVIKYQGFHKEEAVSPDDRDKEIAEREMNEDSYDNNDSSDEDGDNEKWKEYWAGDESDESNQT